jgi:hypothetical protein
MSIPVRLWVCSTKPSSTGSPRWGGSAIPCLLAETGTGMRVLGKGLLLVDEASQLQPFFSCMASYLACVTTCTTTVLCSVCGQPMAAAPPKVNRETPVCCRGRRCGGAPWARRRPGLRLFLFPKQTKSHNIYYALRASNHSRFFFFNLTSFR